MYTYGCRGIFFFTGPVLLLLTTIFEWIMGNFFSMMACGVFSVFWLSFGMLQLPTLELASPYSSDRADSTVSATSSSYNAVIAVYLVVWGFALFTFWIFTFKTNVVFVLIFIFATVGVWVLSSSYWKLSAGKYEQARSWQKVSFFPVQLSSRSR